MGHLAFAAAIEAIIGKLLFRNTHIIDVAPEAEDPVPDRWRSWVSGVALFFHLPVSLRPYDKC